MADGGNQQQIADAPRDQIVMQEKIARYAVFLDGLHHCVVGAVADGFADARLFAFELIPESASRTFVIAGFGAGLEPIQFGRRTIRAIKVFRAPCFRDVAGLLRTALEMGGK